MGNILSLARVGSFVRQTSGGVLHEKQVDGLVGNEKIDLAELSPELVRMLLGARKQIVVSMDWTEFDYSDQSRISLNLITRHGRATPLVWITVEKSSMRGRRTAQEQKALRLLGESLPEGITVIILADRGFCSTELLSFIHGKMKWDYVIRLRGNLMVRTARRPGRLKQETSYPVNDAWTRAVAKRCARRPHTTAAAAPPSKVATCRDKRKMNILLVKNQYRRPVWMVGGDYGACRCEWHCRRFQPRPHGMAEAGHRAHGKEHDCRPANIADPQTS
jgi:hypothetical protein